MVHVLGEAQKTQGCKMLGHNTSQGLCKVTHTDNAEEE